MTAVDDFWGILDSPPSQEVLRGKVRANSVVQTKKSISTDINYTEIAHEIVPTKLADVNQPDRYISVDGESIDRLPLSEAGNATRLEQYYGNILLYITETQTWLVWKDGAWQHDQDGSCLRLLAMSLGRIIYGEAADLAPDHRASFAKWGSRSQSAQIIDNGIKLLKSSGLVRRSVASLDNSLMVAGINAGKEVLDLRTGTVRPAKKTDLVTKSLGINRVGTLADCPRWLKFLDEIFISSDGRADRALINWFHRWCGYVMTGDTSEQIAVFAIGVGRNGKSVMASVLQHLMGDYARVLSAESLMIDRNRTGSGASPDLAMLPGARFVLSSESEDGSALAEARLKALTGGDSITCRPLYGKPFSFAPSFKLLVASNHKPVVLGTDYGIWRRLRLVEFLARFDSSNNDPHLLRTLLGELEGIASWCVQGCLAWQEQGLQDQPAAIKQATDSYRQEMDTLGEFITECTYADGETKASELYQRYKAWCDDNGFKYPMSAKGLGHKLVERGYIRRSTNKGPYYQGICLKRQILAMRGDTSDAYGPF
ncbi:DNA primase family protein [Eoetvoesiella caeni]